MKGRGWEPYVTAEKPWRTLSIFPSISKRAGPSTASLKKGDAALFIYHKDTWLTASCKQAVCLCMCLRSPCARTSLCQRYQLKWMTLGEAVSSQLDDNGC